MLTYPKKKSNYSLKAALIHISRRYLKFRIPELKFQKKKKISTFFRNTMILAWSPTLTHKPFCEDLTHYAIQFNAIVNFLPGVPKKVLPFEKPPKFGHTVDLLVFFVK